MLFRSTAHLGLLRCAKLQPGEIVFVNGGTGGVGSMVVQMARTIGAEVVTTVGSPEKALLARKAGARHVIDYSKEDFAARVKEITKGKMCAVVYDGVGKATFPGSLDCLRPRGMFVSYGSASGPIEAFNIGILSQKGSLFATRPTLFGYASTPAELAAMARDLFRVVASGKVKISVNHKRPLAEAAAAHRALEARQTTGSTVLIP